MPCQVKASVVFYAWSSWAPLSDQMLGFPWFSCRIRPMGPSSLTTRGSRHRMAQTFCTNSRFVSPLGSICMTSPAVSRRSFSTVPRLYHILYNIQDYSGIFRRKIESSNTRSGLLQHAIARSTFFWLQQADAIKMPKLGSLALLVTLKPHGSYTCGVDVW